MEKQLQKLEKVKKEDIFCNKRCGENAILKQKQDSPQFETTQASI